MSFDITVWNANYSWFFSEEEERERFFSSTQSIIASVYKGKNLHRVSLSFVREMVGLAFERNQAVRLQSLPFPIYLNEDASFRCSFDFSSFDRYSRNFTLSNFRNLRRINSIIRGKDKRLKKTRQNSRNWLIFLVILITRWNWEISQKKKKKVMEIIQGISRRRKIPIKITGRERNSKRIRD